MVDEGIDMISMSDVELESSSCMIVDRFGAGLVSGSMIFAMENFNGPRCGDIVGFLKSGDTGDDCVFDDVIVLLAASMIGLFDVSGIPGGLHGCMLVEILNGEQGKQRSELVDTPSGFVSHCGV